MARNGIAKNGPEENNRSGNDSNSRKMDGDFSDVRYKKNGWKKNIVKNGTTNTIGVKTSGSRFDILNDDKEMNKIQGKLHPNGNSPGNNLKEKYVLIEITNLNSSQDSMSKLDVQMDRNFDAVAVSLKEAIAVILE
ncbi:hypothetical protein LWI28_014733 [Acer negundo]|uniref:Uncharacterized protein n=1 Tax=Acer negundo TaxID=4023 RepID=A0AAD5ILT2_ACENE|nr:hypothetical protein LWI28_014733 [Acer negundo]